MQTLQRYEAYRAEDASAHTSTDRTPLLDAAFDFGLTPSEFKVYFCLVRLADSEQSISESLEKLAYDCKIKSRNTIKRAIEALINMGIVRRLLDGCGYIYHLTDPLDWVERNHDDQKLTRQKLINKSEEQDSITPPIGGVIESCVPCEKESDQFLTRSEIDPVQEDASLEEKVQVLRNRGCRIGTPERNGAMVVMVDGLTLSMAEFMQRSLDSFSYTLQSCPGREMWLRIGEALRQKKEQARVAKWLRLAAIANTV